MSKEKYLKTINQPLDPVKLFPACTEAGLYPIKYVYEGEVYCPMCARNLYLENLRLQDKIIGRIYWEGPVLQCNCCGDEIESAYGDPEEDY